MALSTRCSRPSTHSDVTRVDAPLAWAKVAVPQTLHPIPTPVTPMYDDAKHDRERIAQLTTLAVHSSAFLSLARAIDCYAKPITAP